MKKIKIRLMTVTRSFEKYAFPFVTTYTIDGGPSSEKFITVSRPLSEGSALREALRDVTYGDHADEFMISVKFERS